MSASKCQVLWCLQGNRLQNVQFESPKMKLHEFVRMPTVTNWAKFAVQNLKGWSSDTTANSRAFVYFRAYIMFWSSGNFENSQHLSNSTELRTQDIAGSGEQ